MCDRSSRGEGRVSSVFKESVFGECTGRAVYPKGLTFHVDNLLLERELVQVCTPGGQGSRIPTEVGFALVSWPRQMRICSTVLA